MNVVFKSTVGLEKGLLCHATARGFKVSMDEPEDLGGKNTAMNPVEMLLSSLGGCISICAAAFAPKCGVELDGFFVEVEGDLDPDGFLGKNPDVRKGFSDIRFKMHFESSSSEENIKKLVEVIRENCPVSDTLKGVSVAGDYTVSTGA